MSIDPGLSPRELMLLGAAMGWIACAMMFILIPSWRARSVRHMSSRDIGELLRQGADEIRRRDPAAMAAMDAWLTTVDPKVLRRVEDSLRDQGARVAPPKYTDVD